MVVGDAHRAGLLAVVVAGEKVVPIIPREHRGGVVVVLVPAHVHPRPEVGAGVFAGSDGPLREVVLVVEGDVLRARRIDHLVVVVGVHRRVGEAQHGVHHRRPVHDANRRVQVRLARPQRIAHRPSHALAHFQLSHPHGFAAVGVLFGPILDRQERAGAVVVGNVPLHPARDPGADQPDERRLDDVLVVEEIVVVGLVHRFEHAPADFGENADADILVFEIDHLVGLVRFNVGQLVVQRIGVDSALGALGHPSEVEHRIELGRSGGIGGDDNFFFPNLDGGSIRAGQGQNQTANQNAGQQR